MMETAEARYLRLLTEAAIDQIRESDGLADQSANLEQDERGSLIEVIAQIGRRRGEAVRLPSENPPSASVDETGVALDPQFMPPR